MGFNRLTTLVFYQDQKLQLESEQLGILVVRAFRLKVYSRFSITVRQALSLLLNPRTEGIPR